MMSGAAMDLHYLDLTARIVSAQVGNNAVATASLPDLIRAVHRALIAVAAGPMVEPTLKPQQPAVAVKRSIFPNYIICLEDGKHLKMLKRHLRLEYDLTPHEYRTKWGLPPTYPMVAPAYAERRSVMAKKIGLGQRKVIEKAEPVVKQIPARRARGSRG